MNKAAMLYPSVAMALLTLALLFSLGMRRYAAVAKRKVNPKFYRTFSPSEGEEPESMRRHTRHVNNHFEVPPLFHFAVFATYLVGEVTPVAVGAAWLFVALRCVHAGVHLTYNHVPHRFMVFAASTGLVAFLWVRLALGLAT